MTNLFHATVIDGVLKPDEPLPLPDGSRVRVTIEGMSPPDAKRDQRFNAFLKYCVEHPVYSNGQKFNREELYDRD